MDTPIDPRLGEAAAEIVRTQPLLRTRCTAGWLIITRDTIRIERKNVFGEGGLWGIMPRKNLVGATRTKRLAALYGRGGFNTLTFTNSGGMSLHAKMVNSTDAREAMRLLGYA
jgi:hypothetical protein